MKFDVLRVRDGLISEITTFNADLFEAFGLPPTWPRLPARPDWRASISPHCRARV